MSRIHELSATLLGGERTSLSRWRGQVLLIVNTASRCGFTPQYQALEALHRDLHGQGLAVLGFPCNQFGGQEPGSGAEIAEFCALNYGVSFPMFEKVEVKGPGAHPLFRHLTGERAGLLGTRAIKWNFTKFLVNRDGRVVSRHGPLTRPERLRSAIMAHL